MVKKLLKLFMKKNCRRQIKRNLGPKKVIKRKGKKLYIRWKDYDNSFNSWIAEKDIV